MAAGQPAKGEQQPTQWPVCLQRLQRVCRTGGVEPTRPRQQRRERPSVEMDGQSEQESEQLQRDPFSNDESSVSTARRSASKLASRALGLATTTRCIPPGHRSRRLRSSSRNRRRTAFRTTAVPTLLDTVSPSRDCPSGLGATRPTRGPAVILFPRSWTSRNAWRLRRRTSLGSASDNPTSLLCCGDDQPLAPLGTAAAEDILPGAGAVALAESMGAVPLQLGRLIGALRHGKLQRPSTCGGRRA